VRHAFPRNAAVLVAATVLCLASTAGADSGQAAQRFEVLQAAFHPLTSFDTTRQPLGLRCVLLELEANATSPEGVEARSAAETLLNSTTRQTLVFAEFPPEHSRFKDYYRATLLPTAIFDGTVRDFGGDAQTLPHYQAALQARAGEPARASINVSSATVISTGHLDYEVFSPDDLTGYTVSVRALLVEDPVASAEAGGDLPFVVREYLPGDRVALTGNASQSGRFNFTLDASWVQTRLFAILFVQVDTPAAGQLPAPYTPFDLLGAVIVPLAALVTGVALALMVARYVAAEREARLR
jgi:hypothetical protein